MPRPLTALLAVALLAALPACAPQSAPQSALETAPQSVPVLAPAYPVNFPDPFVLPHDGQFLAYATNADRFEANVQMARSGDLLQWTAIRDGGRLHDALPVLPRWAVAGWTWAPEVLALGDHYLLYFTARERASGRQCTGVARSDSPLGPFVDAGDAPLLCQRALGGTIDASPFRDSDGQLYLYFKPDANAVGKPTEIMVQRLTADGVGLLGEPVALLTNDQPWEGHVIEAPTMVRHAGGYVLFYSANHFGWEPHQRLSPYAMGYARCAGPMGPCHDAPDNPVLHSLNDPQAGCLSGPGHQSVFMTGGQSYIAFHAHGTRAGCRNAHRGRFLHVAPLHWSDGRPVIGDAVRPDTAPPAPAGP